jgi:hypothetical protein
VPYEDTEDEDEPGNELVVLPRFFQLCRLMKADDSWQLRLTFDPSQAPTAWQVSLPNHDRVIDAETWTTLGSPQLTIHPVDASVLPNFLDVEWEGSNATWAVVVDDRHDLPPSPQLADLRSSQLLDALASGKTLAQVLREKLEREARDRPLGSAAIETDPLKRFDSRGTLLRRGRDLARALSALERRLARPATTLDALEARLTGPLGPLLVADKVVREYEERAQPWAEAMFTLAEITLSVARVPWGEALEQIDQGAGQALVRDTLDQLDTLRMRLGSRALDLAEYAESAMIEAKRCLAG